MTGYAAPQARPKKRRWVLHSHEATKPGAGQEAEGQVMLGPRVTETIHGFHQMVNGEALRHV